MTGTENSGHHRLGASLNELDGLQGIQYEMPATLDAFYRRYARPQVEYAATVLGDKEAAKAVVRTLYTHLAQNWDAVLFQKGGPEAYAWRALKLRVETHARMAIVPTTDGCSTSASANDRTTAVHDAVRATLGMMRSQLAAAESPLGLYTAIAALPIRQFDVVILHYVLGYPSSRVADIMGITAATVRTHRRSARRHIAAKLGIALDDEDKE
ncbi:sigma-70 family RNA polymerase sigma factor [Streptomyces sp. FXJ1.172]|uniref:sigma-70 family RNA polymerase sigma factor n=1 Tax=Streptomyces sp. FXJ1.172 TaxID=710705 RepID=UPI0007CF96D4|nr:sigma-70 family RNA polymerase sigma factor [Streptomyces sp. FXJ1.172]WEO93442.1 sigma-70 family RNA polymerase sigma factor [Streptomyces sp. FXJ1.172]